MGAEPRTGLTNRTEATVSYAMHRRLVDERVAAYKAELAEKVRGLLWVPAHGSGPYAVGRNDALRDVVDLLLEAEPPQTAQEEPPLVVGDLDERGRPVFRVRS